MLWGIDRDRKLTIERETEIVDNLAFLSTSTDDPNRVMAVCLEEDPGHYRLVIRMASNTGILDEVEEGFNEIAHHEVSLSPLKTCYYSLRSSDNIVILDYARILSRLPSRHAKVIRKTSGKPALFVSLNKALHDASITPNKTITTDEFERVSHEVGRFTCHFP